MSTGANYGLVGLVGKLTMATRGGELPGEVELVLGSGREAFLAYSPEPLPTGHAVLVVGTHGEGRVDVVAWVEAPGY